MSFSSSTQVVVRNGTIPGQKIRITNHSSSMSSSMSTSTPLSSTLQVPTIHLHDDDVSRNTSTDSSTDSTRSTSSFRSTLSKFVSKFHTDITPAPAKPSSRNDHSVKEKFLNQLDSQASYEDEWSVKNGGGLAGARGLGH
jgi:hypothetical protein